MATFTEPEDLARAICAELDPLMTAYGFQAGQYGLGAEVGIVYCAQHDEFRRRFPNLAPTIRYDDEGACTDLYISASTGAGAQLRDTRFDGVALADMLIAEGPEFSSETNALAELPAHSATVRLRSVLDRLFALHAAG